MEQAAKEKWSQLHPLEHNPYEELPRMKLYTYDMSVIKSGKFKSFVSGKMFNFAEFFRVWEGDPQKDQGKMPKGAKVGAFVYEGEVKKFLSLLCDDTNNSNYPFSTPEYQDYFRHSFWVVPGVKEAKALAVLLRQHSVFKHFEVINVAGSEETKPKETLDKVKRLTKEKDYTITLSCGKLTTGVTIHPWTAVFYLAGSYETSAQSYMQTIFRVQSTGSINGKMKTICYAFDFAPDRTLRVIAETATKSSGKRATGGTKMNSDAIKRFLNFCPVISVKDSKMEEYSVNSLMQQLKQIYISHAIESGFTDNSIFNFKIKSVSEEDLKKFEHLKGQHGSKEKTGVDTAAGGMKDEKSETTGTKTSQKGKTTPKTPAEIEAEKQRQRTKEVEDTIKATLRRVPILIYGADVPIDQELEFDDFINIVDDESWTEFMPDGVTKDDFKNMAEYVDMDVFIGAATQYRQMAKAVDNDCPVMRIRRIAEIFNTFKNPDKETVLTPWRVVNLQLSDTLGGWDFYDSKHEAMLPDNIDVRFIDNGAVTGSVYNTNSKILELNSKSGLYPLYVTYSIFRAKLNALNSKDISIEKELELWDSTVRNNIYVVCRTKMAETITKRTLCGFRDVQMNVCHIEDIIPRLQDNMDELVKEISNSKLFNSATNNNMTFNAIVGNPPYQIPDKGDSTGSTPVYNLFVELAKKLNPSYISMIMESRWFAGGKGLKKFRSDMMADNHIKKLVDYEHSSAIFPGVDIAGGVCYFMRDSGYEGKCTFVNASSANAHSAERDLNEFSVIIRQNLAVDIVKRVCAKKVNKGKTLSAVMSARKPFGLPTDYENKESGVPCWYVQKIGLGYANEADYTDSFGLKDKWKLLLPITPIAGQTDFSKPIGFYYDGNIRIAKPGEICTESWFIAYSSDSKEEILSFKSYLYTKIVRFLLLQAVISQHVTRENFCFVPDLGKYSGEYTDEKLRKDWGIKDKEWEYIDSRIKSVTAIGK